MITLVTDASNTAPAAISFACLINGWNSAVTVSANFSIAVFINSSDSTILPQRRIMIHCEPVMRKIIPITSTSSIINNSILKFRSLLPVTAIPLMAFRKELMNVCCFILTRFLSHPFPPKCHTTEVHKKINQRITHRMCVTVNSNKKPNI